MSYTGPELNLLAASATVQTPATVAKNNIVTRMQAAFNQLVQAWQASRTTMWSTATDPQDIADAWGTYALEWFTFMDDVQTLINSYVLVADALPDFVHADYVVTEDTDSGGNTVGTVTISGALDPSGE